MFKKKKKRAAKVFQVSKRICSFSTMPKKVKEVEQQSDDSEESNTALSGDAFEFGTKIRAIFDSAQRTTARHKRAVVKLNKLFTEHPEEFREEIKTVITNLLTSGVQDASIPPPVLRIINFIALLTLNISTDESDKGAFTRWILTYLCETSHALISGNGKIRQRAATLVATITTSFTEKLPSDISRVIEIAMGERLQDRVPQIRVQAVTALAKFEHSFLSFYLSFLILILIFFIINLISKIPNFISFTKFIFIFSFFFFIIIFHFSKKTKISSSISLFHF